MHRIDGPGHVGNQWVEKDPGLGIPGTTFTSDFQNTVQEELAGVVEGAGITLSKPDNSQLLAAILALGGAVENKIVNGLFEIWGPSGNGPSSLHDLVAADGTAVLAEPWGFNVGDSAAAATTLPADFALGTIPPGMEKLGQPRMYLDWDQTVGSTATAPFLVQPIESVFTYAGRVVTFSCVARVTSGTLAVTPRIVQDYGPGGSADDLYTGSDWILTTSWQRFTFTVTLGGIGGKTLSTDVRPDGRSFLEVRMTFPNATTFNVQICDVRLDPGTNPFPLWRSLTQEQDLAMRYFEKSADNEDNVGVLGGGGGVFGNFFFGGGRNINHAVKYRVRKYGAAVTRFHCYSFTGTGGRDTLRIETGTTLDTVYSAADGGDMGGPQIFIAPAETPTNVQEQFNLQWWAYSPVDPTYTVKANT